MLILGIETSCDETAAALVEYKRRSFFIHSNIVASQVKIHSKYGGIVPEVAARKHVENIIPVIDEALRAVSYRAIEPYSHRAKNKKSSTALRLYGFTAKKGSTAKEIDAIAVVNGPGLITSLLVGVETAKALAFAWDKPLIAVNHLEAHIYSAFLSRKQENKKTRNQVFDFPALALIVSGGHTQLVLMTRHGEYKVIGETRDDAAGEAFDKVAKLLGLGYPGGPVISAYAEKILNSKSPPDFASERTRWRAGKIQNKSKIQNSKFKTDITDIELPRPMMESGDFNFSFSGLKTAVLYNLKSRKAVKPYSYKAKNKKSSMALRLYGSTAFTADICHEFQQAVIDVLTTKTQRAAKEYGVKTVILCGGVSANKELRRQMKEKLEKESPNCQFLVPSPGLSTDNAAMVGIAGALHFLKKDFVKIEDLDVDPNLNL